MDQLRQGCGDDGMVSEVDKLNGYSAKIKLNYIRSSTTPNCM